MQRLLTAWLYIGIVSAFFVPSCKAGSDDASEDQQCMLPITNKGIRGDHCSHTHFDARQLIFNNVYQHNLGLYWWYHDIVCEDAYTSLAVQLTPFYQRSHSASQLARFFLPCNKTGQISVREDGLGDIGSIWLGLIAPSGQQYEGWFSLRPERDVVGNYVDLRMSLSSFVCNSWLDVTFAIQRVRHRLNFCTHEGEFPGAACNITTLCQAFSPPDWQYGKLWQGTRSVVGVSDVQIKLGMDWFYCDTNHLSPYLLVGVATQVKGCSEYLFSPSIATDSSSFGFGIIGDLGLAFTQYSSLTLLVDFKYRHEFGARVHRSFDLCPNGNWSRYLLMVAQEEPSNTLPGINFMTQEVKVYGTNTIDWWSALHYKWKQFHVEAGYDLWWHQRERVRLCSFPDDIGIYDLAGQCSLNPTSASNAMICQSILNNQPTSDATFIPLTPADINLNSGAMPTRLSSTLYAVVGYDAYVCGHPLLFGFGGAYEFGHGITALNNANVWVKVGMGF